MVNFYSQFLSCKDTATVQDAVGKKSSPKILLTPFRIKLTFKLGKKKIETLKRIFITV